MGRNWRLCYDPTLWKRNRRRLNWDVHNFLLSLRRPWQSGFCVTCALNMSSWPNKIWCARNCERLCENLLGNKCSHICRRTDRVSPSFTTPTLAVWQGAGGGGGAVISRQIPPATSVTCETEEKRRPQVVRAATWSCRTTTEALASNNCQRRRMRRTSQASVLLRGTLSCQWRSFYCCFLLLSYFKTRRTMRRSRGEEKCITATDRRSVAWSGWQRGRREDAEAGSCRENFGFYWLANRVNWLGNF